MNTDMLRKAAESATPGPWEAKDEHGDIYSADGKYICDTLVELARESGADLRAEADAEFIATFDPQVVGALLDIVEGVYTDLEYDDDTDLRAALDRFDALAEMT